MDRLTGKISDYDFIQDQQEETEGEEIKDDEKYKSTSLLVRNLSLFQFYSTHQIGYIVNRRVVFTLRHYESKTI